MVDHLLTDFKPGVVDRTEYVPKRTPGPMVRVAADSSTETLFISVRSIARPPCISPRVVEYPWRPPVAKKGTSNSFASLT